MKLCKQPCMDCPYSRGSEVIESPQEFFDKHTSPGGKFEPYICEEQGDICLGQAVVIRNRMSEYLVLDKEFKTLIESVNRDYDNFFLYGFVRHHEGRSLIPSPPSPPEQGSLF